jgi:hypothetical protein
LAITDGATCYARGPAPFYFQFGNIFGLAFNIDISERLKINLGFGFSYQVIAGEYNADLLANFNCGIDGNIDCVYDTSSVRPQKLQQAIDPETVILFHNV